ncbi:MAG TPA: LuxR C-terminal-related transcriptional regulator [Trebonia sp.]|jgi:LuxR family maltose regulon positive regulatory protein
MTQLASVSSDDAVTAEPALLDGKFRAPAGGADVVHRERLTALIEEAAERPVTVITAPPGAGKTVACAGWAAARARSRRIAWLSLDDGDRDPARFWACVTAALAAGGTALGSPLVPRSREARDDLPSDLVNTVRKLSSSVVLVIDDMHMLADSEVLPGLALLIHHAPAALRLILCGRSAPGLHLAKMRLSGYLSEVQASDLACTADEAEAYIGALGLAGGALRRDSLMRATEGWMAGPRLAALMAARDGDLNVDAMAADPIVADYMRDEVLDRQPPGVRQFLRRTSIAERLTPGFADLLTGESGGARILDTLNRENSFVCRDRQGKYRYHPFLRQVLLGELRREMPAEVPVLFTRASQLAARQGDVIEAVRCVAEAAEWDAVPRVLTEAGLAGALPDRAGEFEAALGRLPAEWRAEPAVAAALAMVRLCRGDPDSAVAYLDLAALALDESTQDRLVIELWLGMLRLIRQPDDASIAFCRSLAEQARASAGRQSEHQALGLLWLALGTVLLCRWEVADSASALTVAVHQLTAAGTSSLAMRARGWLALSAALGGDLAAATAAAGRLRTAAPPDPAAVCLATIAAAQVAIERDDLHLALRLLDEADPATTCPLPGEPDIAVLLATARARAALAEGDAERAGDLARLAREKYEHAGQVLSVLDVDIALRAGDLGVAAAALGPPAGGGVTGRQPERPDRMAARARLLLADGDPAAALSLALSVACEDADPDVVLLPTLRNRVTALLTAVVAARRTGTDDKAAKLLEEALTSAEPHDMYRPFLDGGGAVHSAIALLISPSSPAAGFAARVHERFVCQPSSRAAGSGAAGHETPALTTSELAVLRLLRSYMSNQDIADTLFLSVNTVKTHLRSVYYKLGVSSRREAVERGVRLQIL